MLECGARSQNPKGNRHRSSRLLKNLPGAKQTGQSAKGLSLKGIKNAPKGCLRNSKPKRLFGELKINLSNVLKGFFHVRLNFFDEFLFRYSDGFAGDAKLIRNGLKGERLFGNESFF
jgi:hypothetical protein